MYADPTNSPRDNISFLQHLLQAEEGQREKTNWELPVPKFKYKYTLMSYDFPENFTQSSFGYIP